MRNWYGIAIARPRHIEPAITELLTGSDRHDWSIDELTAALAERGLRADFSSVYRAVNRMVDEGSASEVELGDGKSRFEAAGAHHEHVRCERCGKVSAFQGCLIDGLIPKVERNTGFSITDHRLLLSGSCPSCSPKAGG